MHTVWRASDVGAVRSAESCAVVVNAFRKLGRLSSCCNKPEKSGAWRISGGGLVRPIATYSSYVSAYIRTCSLRDTRQVASRKFPQNTVSWRARDPS